MNNEFLEELGQKPIVNTFKLAYKMLLSNKFLFVVVTIIFIFLSIAQYLIPVMFLSELAEISMILLSIVVVMSNIVSQIFTEANYLYICKILLDSNTEEECLEKMATTKVLTLFLNYFTRAMGSSLAIVLIVAPFIVIREELNMGEYLDVFLAFLMLLLLLALYVYSIVAYKITLSKNFKEAFIATFSLFSPSVWKQSFNLSYAKFVISFALILYGVYYILTYAIDNISLGFGFTWVSIVVMVVMTILSMFFALFVLPVSMMIAQHISADNKDK